MDVREGDFLAMDVHEWHCNTEFKNIIESTPYLKFGERDFKNSWHYNRLSLVCYLRNNMYRCNERIDQKKKEYNIKT